MDATTAAERSRDALDRIGALRFRKHPEIGEVSEQHWSLVYLVGRSCVLGAGPHTAAAVMGYFPVPVVAFAYAQVEEEQDAASFRQRYLDAGHRIGDRVLGEVEDAEELADLLDRLVFGLDPIGRPLAAAWSETPIPDGVGARIERAALILREARGDDHLHVVAAHGLLGPEALLLSGLWRDREDPEATAQFFGWRDPEALQAAWERLIAAGRVTPDRELTDAGREERAAMEALTAATSAQPWEVLAPDQRERCVDLLTKAAEAF